MWRKAKIFGPQKDLEPFPLGGQQRVECDLVSGGGIESIPVLDSWDNLCSGSEV